MAELNSLAASEMEQEDDLSRIREVTEDAPIVKLVNLLISQAVADRASDIHIEPAETDVRVRYRIDGVMHEVDIVPKAVQSALISRLKIMSNVDITERRVPQNGRITIQLGQRKVDFRTATLPTVWGEKVVLRVLDTSGIDLELRKLGFTEHNYGRYSASFSKPHGMILVTGPTGSGKSTTLYATLTEINKPTVNIITVEDPVEYRLSGVNQVHVDHKAGLTFAAVLPAILRSDPDIVLIGEIRDRVTAQLAVEAALTGHLVLSTLHTNDAPSTVSRLLNMGIEPFLVTSAVNLILAQRLARKLCQECKKPVDVPQQALLDIGVQPDEAGSFQVFEPGGCRTCNDRGYKGRVALYEVMPLWDSLKELVINGASTAELKAEAIRLGMQTLRMAGIAKLKSGMTSIEEVVGNTAPDTMR